MTRQEENRELLKLFAPLRVADVRDGMDWMGYHFYGTLDKNIRPLWRTRICGIARTARYLPFEGPTPLLRGEEYTQWSNWYYNNVATYPWIEEIEDGDVIVLDMSGVDVGLMGSDNTLACVACRRCPCGPTSPPRRWTRPASASAKRTCPWPSAASPSIPGT